jgi:hypothetical protein
LRQGKQGYVEAFGSVVSEKLSGEEAAVFRLGVPVKLEADGG